MFKKAKGQIIVEYFVTMVVILAVVLSTGFIGRVRSIFSTYFTKAAGIITTSH
jgi:hypothetical protein